jgi:hypothetical protein
MPLNGKSENGLVTLKIPRGQFYTLVGTFLAAVFMWGGAMFVSNLRMTDEVASQAKAFDRQAVALDKLAGQVERLDDRSRENETHIRILEELHKGPSGVFREPGKVK